MRDIEKKAAKALLNGDAFHCKNTEVTSDGRLLLHGHEILRLEGDGAAVVSLCGWNTITTRSRLNNICRELRINFRVWQRNYMPEARYITPSGLTHDGEICSDDVLRVSRGPVEISVGA